MIYQFHSRLDIPRYPFTHQLRFECHLKSSCIRNLILKIMLYQMISGSRVIFDSDLAEIMSMRCS